MGSLEFRQGAPNALTGVHMSKVSRRDVIVELANIEQELVTQSGQLSEAQTRMDPQPFD
jgi:hypothetical protein